MAQYQSIDPTLVAINAAKKVTPQVKKPVPASLTTQAPIQPSLNLQTQQPQAISTNITPPPANIGGISSPFGAPNINSAPMLGGATPQEIGTRATQLQSLPKQIPASGPSMIIPKDTFREKVIQGKQAGFTSTQILQRYKDKGYSIEGINYDDFLEPTVQQTPLQGGSQPNMLQNIVGTMVQPLKTMGEGLAGLATKAGEYLDPDTYNPAIQAANAATMGAGLVDGSIQPRSEAENRYMNKSLSQNILDTAEGTAYTAGSLYAPITSAVFTVGGQVPYLKDALGVVGKGFSRVGEQLKYIPGYNQYRESLPPEDQARLDGLAGNMIAAFVGSKGKGKLTKRDLQGYLADNFSDFASLDKAFGQSIVKGTKATIAGVKKGAQGAGNFGLEVLGKTTGTSAETIKQVYKAAAKGDTSAIEGLRGVIDDADVIESMKSSVQEIIDDRKTLYGKGYEELKKTKTPIDIRQVAGDTLRDLNNDLGVRFDAEGNLDFSQSKVTSPAAQKNLQGIIDDLKNREDRSPLGLDILKQRVQDYARYTPEFAKSDRFATAVSNKIKNKITEIVPSYEDMVKNYGQASDLLKEIKQATAVGGNKANIATIGTKLKGLLRDNQEVRRMIVEKMQEVTGKNILGQVAGLQMQPRAPKGLQGVALGAGVGVLSQLADPTLLGGLLVASPRLVGEVANAVGVSVNFVQNFADNFKSFFKKNANGLDVSNGDMLRPSLPAGNVKVKPSKGQTPTPPTPKTPPITVEKGAIGMGTPKAKVTPVIPPKATVAPSVSAPKTTTLSEVDKGLNNIVGNKIYNKNTIDDFIKKAQDIPGFGKEYLVAKKIKTKDDFIKFINKQVKQNHIPDAIDTISDAVIDMSPEARKKGLEGLYKQIEKSGVPVAPKKGMPKLGRETLEQNITKGDDLIQEAKKYKSADEFVNKNIFYRGETGGGGNYYSTSKDFALEFTPSGLEKEVMKKGILQDEIYKQKELPFAGSDKEISNAINIAKKNGKKAILVSEGVNQPNSVFVFDKSALKTESQLKQIREQANKKTLPPLPKKGK